MHEGHVVSHPPDRDTKDNLWEALCVFLRVDPAAYFRVQIASKQAKNVAYVRRWNLAQDVWDELLKDFSDRELRRVRKG
jgi:hypothetical protein